MITGSKSTAIYCADRSVISCPAIGFHFIRLQIMVPAMNGNVGSLNDADIVFKRPVTGNTRRIRGSGYITARKIRDILNQRLSVLIGSQFTAVEHEIAVLRHMTVENRHLVRRRNFCAAEIEPQIIAVGHNVNRIVFRIGMSIKVILNLAHGILSRINLKDIAPLADLGKNGIFVRHVAVDDHKLVSAVFNRIRQGRINLIRRIGVHCDIFVDFRMNHGIMKIAVSAVLKISVGIQGIRKRGIIQSRMHGKIAVFRHMVTDCIQICGGNIFAVQFKMFLSGVGAEKIGVDDELDGIEFAVTGIQIRIDLLHGVTVMVKNKHFGIVRKRVEVKVFRRIGVDNDQIVSIGRERIGEGKFGGGVVGEVSIQEI